MVLPIFKVMSRFFPALKEKLIQAGLAEKPEHFIKRSFLIAFYLTTVLMVLLTILFIRLQVVKWLLFIIFPVLLLLIFINFVKRPDLIIKKKQREFDREIVFAGKFLVIELQSGIPIYNALINVSRSHPGIGKYFKEILNRIDIGTPIEDAINESIELTVSPNFRKLLWQMYNSLKTGADLAEALKINIDQIAADQIIEVKEYGKKLNPIVMFYMVVAVIFPSIGIIMFIVFSSFFAISVNLVGLMLVAFVVALIQVVFLMMVKGSRPAVGI